LPRRKTLALSEPKRTLPVVLDAESTAHTISFKLPFGWTVDELPDPVTLDAPFGSYRATAEKSAGKVTLKRTLLIKRSTIPAAEVASVRTFFEKLRAADDAPFVLKKE